MPREFLKGAPSLCGDRRRSGGHLLCCGSAASYTGEHGKCQTSSSVSGTYHIFSLGSWVCSGGYFQAYRNMLPTSLSQIVEQIAVAVVALVMANFMVNYFADAETNVLRSWSCRRSNYGNRRRCCHGPDFYGDRI